MRFPAAPALIGLTLVASAAPAAAGRREVRMMDRIEHQVTLPEGAAPLAGYTRLYAWAEGRRKVRAFYRIGPDSRRWLAEERFPTAYDGGCAYINLTYDVASGTIEAIGCHGVA